MDKATTTVYEYDHVRVHVYVHERKSRSIGSCVVEYRRGFNVLSYQKLDVYQCAIKFLALVASILCKLPRGYSFLADELKRAAISIPQNIAEGVGKPTEADRSRYFGIARGSAMECGAILDACSVLGLAHSDSIEKGRDLLERIVSMLSKMMKI
jgi:four helix bundle protein